MSGEKKEEWGEIKKAKRRRSRRRQDGETNLERDHDLPLRQSHQHVKHVRVSSGCDVASSERISFGSIEPSRDCGSSRSKRTKVNTRRLSSRSLSSHQTPKPSSPAKTSWTETCRTHRRPNRGQTRTESASRSSGRRRGNPRRSSLLIPSRC